MTRRWAACRWRRRPRTPGLQQLTFPLVPRRRPVGLVFGGMHSARRGTGTDVAGSRPYRPGDNVVSIDWNASAKLSAARGTDDFIVREHYSVVEPRVVVVFDRRPVNVNILLDHH